jgi:hypothetical protein
MQFAQVQPAQEEPISLSGVAQHAQSLQIAI